MQILRALPGVIAAVFISVSPALAASVHIGSFVAVGDEPNVRWTNFDGYKSGGAFSTIGESRVRFTFGDGSEDYASKFAPGLFGLSDLGALDAQMVITGPAGPYYSEYGYQTSLTVSFIYAGAAPLNVNGQMFHAGANLYTSGPGFGTGNNQYFYSAIHTSDLADFSLLTGNAGGYFNLGFSPPRIYKSWAPYGEEWIVESYEGRFASGSFGGSVPEPGTWALMIVGFGIAGAALRRRRLEAA